MSFVPDQPICIMRRLRVLVGGVECHDIQDYGRVVQMFSNLLPCNRKMNDVIEGFGSDTRPQLIGDRATLSNPKQNKPIPANEYRRVLSQIMAPLLTSSGRLLPLALMGGVIIEMELDAYDACFDADAGFPSSVASVDCRQYT